MPKISGAMSAYEILKNTWDENKIELQEQFKIILLNRSSRVLGILEISTGGITGTIADIRLIFVAALKANATGIILSHNHPSGNLSPSQPDIDLTKKIVKGGEVLNIKVLDHIIVSTEGYYSFSDEGVI